MYKGLNMYCDGKPSQPCNNCMKKQHACHAYYAQDEAVDEADLGYAIRCYFPLKGEQKPKGHICEKCGEVGQGAKSCKEDVEWKVFKSRRERKIRLAIRDAFPGLVPNKSKCDGTMDGCAACLQVYGTDCIYDPNSDHRRKGVYKNDIADLKTRETTLQTLVEAILNSPEEDVPALVQEIRTCESLDDFAARLGRNQIDADGEDNDASVRERKQGAVQGRTSETQLYGKMGYLRLMMALYGTLATSQT
ncbi:hypothetical protein LTR17_018346 [Elasticomyces elasticus]|nr:hypothetical protein LTR17_018346 [Elasticomyces elasticus]